MWHVVRVLCAIEQATHVDNNHHPLFANLQRARTAIGRTCCEICVFMRARCTVAITVSPFPFARISHFFGLTRCECGGPQRMSNVCMVCVFCIYVLNTIGGRRKRARARKVIRASVSFHWHLHATRHARRHARDKHKSITNHMRTPKSDARHRTDG